MGSHSPGSFWILTQQSLGEEAQRMGTPHLRGGAQTPAQSHCFQHSLSWEKPGGKHNHLVLGGQSTHHHSDVLRPRPPEGNLCLASALPLLKRSTRLCHTPASQHRDVLAGGISPGQKGFPYAPPLSFHLRWCSPNPGMICASNPNLGEGQDTSLRSPP